jgi:hypothetical protein
VSLHEPLNELAEIDPQQSRIVELKFFGGLSIRRDRRSHWHRPRHSRARLEDGARLAAPGVVLIRVIASLEAQAVFSN